MGPQLYNGDGLLLAPLRERISCAQKRECQQDRFGRVHHVLTRVYATDSLAHNVRMSEKRTKADKAQREADQLDKKLSRRPPQNQGRKPREDFNQAAVRIVEEAAEKH